MHPAMMKLPGWSKPAYGKGRPGKAIIFDLAEQLYHGSRSIVSKSALSRLAESPYHFLAELEGQYVQEDTDAMRFGGAYHVAVLEPDLYDAKVVVMPRDLLGTSKKLKALREMWIEEEADEKHKIWLSPKQHQEVIAMRDTLYRFDWVRRMLRPGGRAEVTALWTCNETGIRCKSRADWLHADGGTMVDLKSAVSAAPQSWRYAAKRMGYDMQDAMYSRAFEENGVHIPNFIFLVQEKKPPYAPASYQLSDDDRLEGEMKYMGLLRKLRDCIERDHWPSYTNGVADLRLPKIHTGLDEFAEAA